MIYAHRGAHAQVPENTIDAFQQGLIDGADALELDVRLSKDDVIVVFHDEDAWRLARRREYVNKSTWSEIQEWDLSAASYQDSMVHHFTTRSYRVPSLEEVLKAFPDVPLNVDIKVSSLRLTSLVIELIRRYDAMNRVRLTSPHWQVHQMLHALRYEGLVGLSQLEVAMVYFLPESLIPNWSGRAIQIPRRWGIFRFDTPTFIEKCHRLGLQVDYWVINDREQAKILWKNGADGIMSDDPAQILASRI